jgi:hypothetical protein
MIAYNVTIKIEKEIEKEWLQWVKKEYISEVLATGLFAEYKFYRLLENDETDGITYVVQYFAPSLENYKNYSEKFFDHLQKKSREKWNGKSVAFHTVMEIVN